MNAPMVVVGAGECGAHAVAELRAAGWTGEVELVGAEPHLPYERPPLSKSTLTTTAAPHPVTVHHDAALRSLGVRYRPGAPATEIDRENRTVLLTDGTRIAYHSVLLATGAGPRQLPMTAGLTRTRTLRTYDDAIRLRSDLGIATSVAIIGAGFIGLEVASAATAMGCAVTVLEAADRILGRAVPEKIAEIVDRRHRAAGVDLRCGVKIIDIEETQDKAVLTTDDGNTIQADVVVIGVGAVPHGDLANKAGLRIDNGIRVDKYLRTDDPLVYAAGDCCSFPHGLFGDRRIRIESWRNAADQGRLAARNMCGRHDVYEAVPWFWSDQYELTLQVAGLFDAAHVIVVRHRPDGVDLHFGVDEAGHLVSAAAIGEGNAVARDIRLAEKAIGRQVIAHEDRLADPGIPLKRLFH